MTRLRAELAELRTSHEGLSQKNEVLSSELRTEREAAATKKGEVAALEKRISSQVRSYVSLSCVLFLTY